MELRNSGEVILKLSVENTLSPSMKSSLCLVDQCFGFPMRQSVLLLRLRLRFIWRVLGSEDVAVGDLSLIHI